MDEPKEFISYPLPLIRNSEPVLLADKIQGKTYEEMRLAMACMFERFDVKVVGESNMFHGDPNG